jgi:DNA-binding PadR family transcriptional regulator
MTDRKRWGWGFRPGPGWGSWSRAEHHSGFAGGLGGGLFGGQRRFFESGQVRLAILSLLGEGPKHGYEIIKELGARSGGLYRASAGTVYPTLQLLDDEGLVESDRQDGRRVYRLTAAGRRELESEAPEVARIWKRAANWEDWSKWMGPEAAMIMGPLGAVMKAAFQAAAHAGDDPAQTARVREILDRAVRDLDATSDAPSSSPHV